MRAKYIARTTTGPPLGQRERSQPGQGLFVARGDLAKMGGLIAVRNEAAGVCFRLTLQR